MIRNILKDMQAQSSCYLFDRTVYCVLYIIIYIYILLLSNLRAHGI